MKVLNNVFREWRSKFFKKRKLHRVKERRIRTRLLGEDTGVVYPKSNYWHSSMPRLERLSHSSEETQVFALSSLI